MNEPVLSVVLINWNAGAYIVGCVQSVLASDFRDLEIILVDNFSSDGSIDLLKKALTPEEISKVKIIVNDKNYGAAYALNQGAALARGAYITFLATDTKVAKDCFLKLTAVFLSDPTIGALGAKLLLMHDPTRFDSVGEYISQFGLLLQRHAGQEIDRGQFNRQEEIFSVKGTALSVRKEVFSKAGGFPEEYFMFLEETDLCWRIWLSGYRIVFVPDALIYHASGISIKGSARKSYLVHFFGTRNYITTMLKNFGLLRLCVIVPFTACMWFGLALVLVFKGRLKDGWFVIKGIFWNIFHIGSVFKKRVSVQKARVISDKDLMAKVMKTIDLKYLLDRVRSW